MTHPNTYYHNDFKRINGIDQTRTASEKGLDRLISARQLIGIKQSQPNKKVKDDRVMNNFQIFQKILTTIGSEPGCSKLLKAMQLLRKCLLQESFIRDQSIAEAGGWSQIFKIMLKMDDKIKGPFAEASLLMEAKAQIIDRIKPLIKECTKEPQMLDSIIELQWLFCNLFTDDSFSFNKTLAKLKSALFSYFQKKGASKVCPLEQLIDFPEKMMLRLFSLPYGSYDWIKSALAAFFKEFNVTYRECLDEPLRKSYLQSYNVFLHSKVHSNGPEAMSIFGNGSKKGAKVTLVQMSHSDGTDEWTHKQ